MNNEHTPGPWTINESKETEFGLSHYRIVAPNPDANDPLASYCGAILSVVDFESDNPSDALLIAAAPGLLAACQLFMIQHDWIMSDGEDGTCPPYRAVYDAIRAAITKATP